MAKGQFLSGHQQGIVKRYYDNLDTISLQKLAELVSDIAVCTDARKAGELWQRAHKALQKTPADQLKASRVVAERNVEALAKLVGELSTMKPTGASKPAAAAAQAPVAPGPEPAPAAAPPKPATAAPITEETLTKAFAAFKKRLKLTQLEQDSKLGRSPLSSGKSHVSAITPPREYPRAVWDELFAQGKIRPVGGGMFELVWTPGGK